MLDGGAPSQVKRSPDFRRYIPLSGMYLGPDPTPGQLSKAVLSLYCPAQNEQFPYLKTFLTPCFRLRAVEQRAII